MVIFISNLINNPKYDYLACLKRYREEQIKTPKEKNISFYNNLRLFLVP